MPYPIELHRRTPVVGAVEPRRWRAMAVAYHRDDAAHPIEARIERHAHDAVGRLCARWDARSWADGGGVGAPSQSTRWSLSGRPLLDVGVDASWRMVLLGADGKVREGWDGLGAHHQRTYDTQQRPLSVHEQGVCRPARCVERWRYGGPAEASTNGCGRLSRHDDSTGTRDMAAHGLSGGPLVCTQRFLSDPLMPDWPVALTDRDRLLETSAQGVVLRYTTRWGYDAVGVAWMQTDAAGHVRRTAVDVSGRPAWVDFQSVDMAISTIVYLDLIHDASGNTILEMGGHGVATHSLWSPVDGRLQRRRTLRMAYVLQDIDYDYDPVGNLIRLEEHAQPTAWFDGAPLAVASTFRYDEVRNLPGLEVHRNSATGEAWEVASIEAGRFPVRWLHGLSSGRGAGFHWPQGLPPGDVAWRYTVDDHLGSATLELDDVGDVISHAGGKGVAARATPS